MKIVYVDLQYDYGKKNRGPNIIGQLGFKKSFENLGHNVFPFYYDEYLPDNLSKLQVDILNFCSEKKPDLVFFIPYQDQFSFKTLEELKSDYSTMAWFGDDTWRFDNFSSKYAKYFSSIVTTDKYSVEKYKFLGAESVILSQWASVDTNYLVTKIPDYEFDVTFVGGAHPVRKWFVSELKRSGLNVVCFGNGWPNGPVSLERMQTIFNSSKINLNLSNSRTLDIRFLKHSWKNVILVMKSEKNLGQIKARNFEIPYYGGFQLTDYVPGIEDYFKLGEEIVCYTNVDDAAFLINYYLKNDVIRERVRKNGINSIAHKHGYQHRLADILNRMKT